MIDYELGGKMNIIGILCEYNPFHNGHIYHIKKIREKYPHSIIILCVNGYFLERGEVSLLDKFSKTEIALNYGVDIVIELPVLFGTQAADIFSESALKLLHSMGVTTFIFGSETNNFNYLYSLSKKQLEDDFLLKDNLGLCYPKRLSLALQEEKIEPNDILGISYIKTILKNNYPITCELIKRTNSYHDLLADSEIVSASNIRRKLDSLESIDKYLPKCSKNALHTLNKEKLFLILKTKILTESHLEKYLDVTEGLENLLKKKIIIATNYDELVNLLKSKRYTYNRLRRMLIHILLGITKEDAFLRPSYIQILGFNEKGKKYLKDKKDTFLLPIKRDYNSRIYELEKTASIIYDLIMDADTYILEKKNQPIGIGSKDSSQK